MKKRIQKYNDLLSEKYDGATQGEFKWLPPKILTKNIPQFLKPNADILDVGVGTGQTSQIFIKNGMNVTGLDISEKMLLIAQSKYKFKKLIKYDIEKGILTLFPQEKFDIIVASGILEFIPNIKKILAECKKLLKTNGIIVFTYELFEPENKFGTHKISKLSEGVENAPDILNFTIYRHLPEEIDNILSELRLKVIKREKFVGYLKSHLKIPVPYEMLIVN